MLIQVGLIAIAAVLIATSVALPSALSDSGNAFLRGFINHELLATLGVIVAITLASASAIHIELGKIARARELNLDREKQAVRFSSYLLIGQLLGGLVLVVLKPVIATAERPSAFMNAAGLMLIVWSIAILYDLTRAAFKISP